MSKQDLRSALYGSFKNRAMMYYHIYEELKKEVGEDKAADIIKRGIYKRGLEIGKQFAEYGPSDINGLKDAFLGFIPDEGKMLQPEVMRCDDNGVDIKFHRCPLKEAWQEAGLSDGEVATMCEIAAIVDYGIFEGAGFEFTADTYKPGGDGCCLLQISPGK